MNAHDHAHARLLRVKRLWVDLATTPDGSPRYKRLVAEIHSESVAHLADAGAKRGVDRRSQPGGTRNGPRAPLGN